MISTSPNSQDRSPHRITRPASVAPSITSVVSDATTITAPAHQQRGFKSREAYLAALNEFAESKRYMPAGEHTIHGWYGEKTMNDYKNRPGFRDSSKKKAKTSKKEKPGLGTAVEGTVTMDIVHESPNEPSDISYSSMPASEPLNGGPNPTVAEKEGRLRRLLRAFSVGTG